MPAITVADPTTLTRVTRPRPGSVDRPVRSISTATAGVEGAGFPVWRGFTGLSHVDTDPFVLLDQGGPVENAPYETKGAPWHPHRGFETVTYLMDGEIAHRDSNGGGGLIREGDTQWMTAGAGVLHDELPTETTYVSGGWTHAVQLWVNLPAQLKWTQPRYQSIDAGRYTLLASPDAGAVVRLIAGTIDGHTGPGSTYTPITLAHVSLAAGAQLQLPWDPQHSALLYVLDGQGTVGAHAHPVQQQQMVVFGTGDSLTMAAAATQRSQTRALEVLVLGGRPIGEPVAHYGPFVMNTEREIREAFDDFQAGRLGIVPAEGL